MAIFDLAIVKSCRSMVNRDIDSKAAALSPIFGLMRLTDVPIVSPAKNRAMLSQLEHDRQHNA